MRGGEASHQLGDCRQGSIPHAASLPHLTFKLVRALCIDILQPAGGAAWQSVSLTSPHQQRHINHSSTTIAARHRKPLMCGDAMRCDSQVNDAAGDCVALR